MDDSFLPAVAYNSLPTFEDQIDRQPTSDDLAAIREVFLRHSMHHSHAAALLHRHYDIPDAHVMCHDRQISVGLDECLPVAPIADHVAPHSFFLRDRAHFQAFEYEYVVPSLASTSPMSRWSEGFTDEMKQLLISRNLDSTVAIVPLDDNATRSVDSIEMPGSRGVPSMRTACDGDAFEESPPFSDHTIPSAWCFDEEESYGVEVQAFMDVRE